MSNEECCPEFNPGQWDEKFIEWNGKIFIKGRVFTFFYMPVNFGGVITRLIDKAEKAGVRLPDMLCLSDHTSKWNMDIYLEVAGKVPDAENVSLSGKYFSKVFEGPFSDTGKWCDGFNEYTKAHGIEYSKMYTWYTTCPKCAKKYGKNYVAIIAETK